MILAFNSAVRWRSSGRDGNLSLPAVILTVCCWTAESTADCCILVSVAFLSCNSWSLSWSLVAAWPWADLFASSDDVFVASITSFTTAGSDAASMLCTIVCTRSSRGSASVSDPDTSWLVPAWTWPRLGFSPYSWCRDLTRPLDDLWRPCLAGAVCSKSLSSLPVSSMYLLVGRRTRCDLVCFARVFRRSMTSWCTVKFALYDN